MTRQTPIAALFDAQYLLSDAEGALTQAGRAWFPRRNAILEAYGQLLEGMEAHQRARASHPGLQLSELDTGQLQLPRPRWLGSAEQTRRLHALRDEAARLLVEIQAALDVLAADESQPDAAWFAEGGESSRSRRGSLNGRRGGFNAYAVG